MTGLALGQCDLEFVWHGDDLVRDIDDASDLALADCALDAIGLIRFDAPYETGSLHSSVHAAPPGYDADETAIYDRRVEGVHANAATPTVQELVRLIRDGHIWVGSWISYAYYMERGFTHAHTGDFVSGRHYIIPNAERALKNFPTHFRYRYATIAEGRRAA